jgi:glycosyltransferase involved in cell wall biosynthesis
VKGDQPALASAVTPGILYLSYDGMLEPLGQSQVLAYLEKLTPGRRIHLISFEKSADWKDRGRFEEVRARIAAAGVRWHPLRYHKSPTAPATAYDIALGSTIAVALAVRHRLTVVHARSYVAGVMALAVKRATGAAFLFDMRGFWADERVDGNLWPAGGRLYRAAKAIERHLLLAADHVITLTQASEEELRRFPYVGDRLAPVTVIPTCADLDRFTVQGPPQRSPFVLGYIGSVGTWYLLDDMLRCFVAVREQVPGARLLVVNRGEHERIRSRAGAHGISTEELELVTAAHSDVPALIARMTCGMGLIKPVFSKIASAPTKLAEYLGCGVPCMGNAGVGDIATILEPHRVGVALTGFTNADISQTTERLVRLCLDPATQARCRRVAEELFSRERGVAAYGRIYDELARSTPGAAA